MNELLSNRCLEVPGPLTFPDILSDPLVRVVMAADHVDPASLKADLDRIAFGLRARKALHIPTGSR
jgi:hypothetical protein